MKEHAGLSAILFAAVCALSLTGCMDVRHEVLAVSETNIGVDISQSPSTQTPHAKLGYQRVEVAIVPTNRSAGVEAGVAPGGAASNADVLMELRYSGIFSQGANSGIYQRLAVGKDAVEQPGATALFIRNASGDMSPEAAAAIASLKKTEIGTGALKSYNRLLDCYWHTTPEAQAKIVSAADGDLRKFVDSKPTAAQIDAVSTAGGCK